MQYLVFQDFCDKLQLMAHIKKQIYYFMKGKLRFTSICKGKITKYRTQMNIQND